MTRPTQVVPDRGDPVTSIGRRAGATSKGESISDMFRFPEREEPTGCIPNWAIGFQDATEFPARGARLMGQMVKRSLSYHKVE